MTKDKAASLTIQGPLAAKRIAYGERVAVMTRTDTDGVRALMRAAAERAMRVAAKCRR